MTDTPGEPAAGLHARTYRSVAWAAAGSWIRFAVSLGMFAFTVGRLSPADVGAFGVGIMALGLLETGLASSLSDCLQLGPRPTRRQTDALVWLGGLAGLAAAAVLALASGLLAGQFQSPEVAMILPVMALFLPVSVLAAAPRALLSRDLRFPEISRATTTASLMGGLFGIGALLLGAGVWSLVISEGVNRLAAAVLLWRSRILSIGLPTHPREARSLLAFAFTNMGINYLGYLDVSLPRLLAGLLLGPQALGALLIGQRVFALLSQLVLAPLVSVAMSSVARVRDEPAALKALILSLYRLAALVAYPAFFGAMILVPDLTRLVGERWVSALLVVQILLLVGLRTTTGMYNIPILRGTGHPRDSLLLLGLGCGLHLVLAPLGAQFGVVGVAVALLARTLLTWPIGCWAIRRRTGLAIADQLKVGAPYLLIALVMAGLTAALLLALPSATAPVRLICGGLFGVLAYAVLIAVLRPGDRRASLAFLKGRWRALTRAVAGSQPTVRAPR